ncbi:uncharacterized protein LOC131223549 [Magnolia sinica]|uniref:uncharacterized protein LOC131223549 n=1 Tax=Magnolia sinica TaxID=86752 RepID=UPI00265B6725|nr:uncharacterized protein LOC131223549 [Magnolia sinica]
MRKESKIEQYNCEQKSKLMNYVSAKELSEEVERLRNLLQEKSESVDKNNDSIDGQLKSPYGGSQLRSRDISEGSAGLKTLSPCSGVQTEEVMVIPNAGSQEEHVTVKEPERGLGKGMPYSDALGNSKQVLFFKGLNSYVCSPAKMVVTHLPHIWHTGNCPNRGTHCGWNIA